MATRTFGERVQRNNDQRLLTGGGRYVDDIPLVGALHAAFVRSPYARAQIVSIDTSLAKKHPGVIEVYTCDNIGNIDIEMPLLIPHPALHSPKTQRPLAREGVYYVGQTVAMVVAIDRYVAEDASRLVEVAYSEPLKCSIEIEEAVLDSAPLVHPDVPNNIAAHCVQVSGEPEKAFQDAEHFTKLRVRVDRSTAAPMECRAVAARFDSVSGELTVWDGTQAPISVRGGIASIFNIDEDKVRVIAPDVGGGFGQKVLLFYPDELLVPYAAMELNRPVKYIEDRTENFLGSTQERTQIHELELASTKDGIVLGLKDSFLHDTGAFIPYGIAVAQVASSGVLGPYRIPNSRVEYKAIYTPIVPVTPYRGCGRPHACFAIERAMDQLADELGLDRFEVRRRNLIAEDEFPYERPNLLFADGLAVIYDSGQYTKALDMIHEKIDLDDFKLQQSEAAKDGRYLGLGLSFYVEATGIGPYEGGHIKIHPITGKVYVNTGLTTQGQGHETVFAQIVSDQLGVDPADVILVEGDTGAFDWGVATYASRAAVVSGNAIHLASVKARKIVMEAAGNMLEASTDDLELEGGEVKVRGSDVSVSLAAVATACNPLRYAFNEAAQAATQFAPAARSDEPALGDGRAPGIETTEYYAPPHATWAYGVHAAILEVDPGLCSIDIKRYICVHDCGNMINPTLVEGQVMGGVAQGMGGAFFERVEFDSEGNPRNANFMDFLVPYATEVPQIELHHIETPSPLNPLGVKGVGEAGTIPVAPVIASAIEDALKPLGIKKLHNVPLSPNSIYEALIESGWEPKA